MCRLFADGRPHRQPCPSQRPQHHACVRVARIAGRHREGEGANGLDNIPWYTIVPRADSAFDIDFGVDEWHGTNAFIRDGDRVFRTYFINNRGDEVFVNTWNFLDMTALGRQETWEDSPEGYPQTKPYEWWSWHDEYAEHEPSRWFGEPDPDDANDQRPPREPGE